MGNKKVNNLSGKILLNHFHGWLYFMCKGIAGWLGHNPNK
jgi:hypothetical protein